MLLGLQPQAGQAGVARVPVHVGAGCGGVRTGTGGDSRVEARAVQIIDVSQVVEAWGRYPGHSSRDHG